MDTNSSSTLHTQKLLTEEFNRHHKIVKVKNYISLSCLLTCLLTLILITFLPVFHVGNIKISNNYYLTSEDIFTLSKLDKNKHNLFLDCSSSEEKLLSSSNDILESCSFSSNGLVSSLTVKESFPVCVIKDETYFSNGLTKNKMYENISNLALDSSSIQLIKSNYDVACSSNLINIHESENITFTSEKVCEVSKLFKNCASECFNYIVGVCFVNNNNDSNYSNVAKALIEYNSKYYLLNDLLSVNFAKYFAKDSFINTLLPALDKSCEEKQIQTSEFKFDDDDHVYQVYNVKVIYNTSINKIYAIEYK